MGNKKRLGGLFLTAESGKIVPDSVKFETEVNTSSETAPPNVRCLSNIWGSVHMLRPQR
jgi:hypothetical protein